MIKNAVDASRLPISERYAFDIVQVREVSDTGKTSCFALGMPDRRVASARVLLPRYGNAELDLSAAVHLRRNEPVSHENLYAIDMRAMNRLYRGIRQKPFQPFFGVHIRALAIGICGACERRDARESGATAYRRIMTA